MTLPELCIELPDWLLQRQHQPAKQFASINQRMDFVIELSRDNVEHQTGGPFAAAVFDIQSHELIAAATNLVTSAMSSVLHAEIVALLIAQHRQHEFILGMQSGRQFELISSTEPCAMCLGAIPWSGVKQLVCAATESDARAIGFDEGDKPTDWIQHLEKRGIHVMTEVNRTEAVAVLKNYQARGGIIYNG